MKLIISICLMIAGTILYFGARPNSDIIGVIIWATGVITAMMPKDPK